MHALDPYFAASVKPKLILMAVIWLAFFIYIPIGLPLAESEYDSVSVEFRCCQETSSGYHHVPSRTIVKYCPCPLLVLQATGLYDYSKDRGVNHMRSATQWITVVGLVCYLALWHGDFKRAEVGNSTHGFNDAKARFRIEDVQVYLPMAGCNYRSSTRAARTTRQPEQLGQPEQLEQRN